MLELVDHNWELLKPLLEGLDGISRLELADDWLPIDDDNFEETVPIRPEFLASLRNHPTIAEARPRFYTTTIEVSTPF